MYTILVADDDPIMLGMVERLMQKEGYAVVKSTTAKGVHDLLKETSPDLFLIDMNLPDDNGLSICKAIRNHPEFAESPIIFLTGVMASPNDVAEALNVGGDDYIHKPFAARELAARVRAQLRRIVASQRRGITVLQLNLAANLVLVDGEREVELTPVEFNLLYHMCRQPNTWQTTRDLLADVWRYPGNIGDAALVRNHIRNIRRKIEANPDHPSIILSRHRRGYLVDAQVSIIGEATH
jgi:two-component system, OmpR family, response regulator VicR